MNNENIKTHDNWQALHLQLQDLLAAYADDMLDQQDKQLVEAHLSGCEACQMDVSRQQLLSSRLNNLPVTRMSTKMHQRLDKVLSEASKSEASYSELPETAIKKETSQAKSNPRRFSLNWRNKLPTLSFATLSGWGVAMMLLVVMLSPNLEPNNGDEIPMVRDVLAEYQKFNSEELPTSDQNLAKIPPASWPDSHVVAQWKTTVAGAPADAFAVRNGDNIIFQYKVDEAVFFHNPDVRLAVSSTGNYQVRNNKLKVLALPLKKAGLLIVGPDSVMPELDKLKIKSLDETLDPLGNNTSDVFIAGN